MPPVRIFAIGLGLLLSAWVPAAAASAALGFPVDAARFQRLGTDQGLSQSTIMALAQDSRGLIWIGTQNGLNRFDGYETRVFLPEAGNPHALGDNFVTSLLPGTDGAMWIGTLDGLSRFDPELERFQNFRARPGEPGSLPGSAILSLHRSANGMLWVGAERGLARWRPEHADFEHWSLADGSTPGLPDPRVSCLASDAGNGLWIGTPRGLVYRPADGNALRPAEGFPFPNAAVAALMVDREQRVWVALDSQGLVLGENGRWHHFAAGGAGGGGLSSNSTRSLVQDAQDRVWVGTDLGLDLLVEQDDGEFQFLHFRHHRQNPNSIGGGGVAALTKSTDGTLWVGSWNGGLAWLNDRNNRFSSYTPDLQVTGKMRNPSSIALQADGSQLWIGTGEGLYRFNTSNSELLSVSGIDPYIYYSVRAAADRRIWFGTTRGLSEIEPGADRFIERQLPEQIAHARVRRLLLDEDLIWLAVDPLGLARVSADLATVHDFHPITRSVTFIEALENRWRLVGTYEGLYWFSTDGELAHLQPIAGDLDPDSSDTHLPAAPMALARAADGRFWLATNGSGLFELVLGSDESPQSARFVRIESRTPLANNFLKALEIDREGRVWMSSAAGISVYDPAAGEVRNFNRHHGTLGRDYINGAATQFADGRIAFGGMDGFTVFNPRQAMAQRELSLTAPLLTQIELGSKADGAAGRALRERLSAGIVPGGVIQLPAGSGRSVSFRFAVAHYVDASLLRYSYRLDGFSTGWEEVDASRRVAAFTNLEPGQYRFRVRAAHISDAVWSDETTLDMEIAPYWWQTWWARLGLIIGVVLSFVLVHRARTLHMARQGDQLSKLVAERTTELRDRSMALQAAKTNAEQSLARLESTQRELLRSEKMAVLGQLVAGVAHEVNTPIGVALTAGTSLRDSTRRIRRDLEANALRRTDLQSYLDTVDESALMVERNLDRAAHLISNFKQVSVDRTSDGRRRFDLQTYMREVLESLELMWKRRSIETRVAIPAGIQLDSFPGALGQVVTNLTQNAVIHAFADTKAGVMDIRAHVDSEGWILIEFHDNGCGISAEHMERLFEPFFTTRRGEGGTGLGLHIVYNLVTQKLGGSISAQSQVGEGSRFVIRIPTQAPGKAG